MLRVLSGISTVVLLISSVFILLGFSVNPFIIAAGAIGAIITFIPLAFKWNGYIIQKEGLSLIKGGLDFLNIFKTIINQRKEKRTQFILFFFWSVYFFLYLISFAFIAVNITRYDSSFLQVIMTGGVIPFASFEIVFGSAFAAVIEKN